MQVQQRSSIRQPIKVTTKKPSNHHSIQNDMASTTTELSGSKSIPFSNTPKIKLKQNLPKSSQNKLVITRTDNYQIQQQTPSKHLFSPQQSPSYDLANSPPQQHEAIFYFLRDIQNIVEQVQKQEEHPLKFQENFTGVPDSHGSVRGLLQREFFSEQLKQQQEQVIYSLLFIKLFKKKKMKDIWDQQILEKQQRIQREKEQRQLEQKLDEERIQLEVRKEQEDLNREKNLRQKYQVHNSMIPPSPTNDQVKKSKIMTEIRTSTKEPELHTQPLESPSEDILQQLIKQNQELKQENQKKDHMIEQLMKNTEKQQQRLNSSKSTQFLIKTNSLRGLTKSSQEKKQSFQNRLPEITTPQPHFSHSKQIKSDNIENNTQKTRVMMLKDEEQNWSFGRPEEIQQSQQPQKNQKNFYTQSSHKIAANQGHQENQEHQVEHTLNSDWANINPGFTFCSSIAEQFKLNPKALNKIKQNPKLPKEFQIAPIKRKFFI